MTDQSWSVDPGVDLAQYDTESSLQPEVHSTYTTFTLHCYCLFSKDAFNWSTATVKTFMNSISNKYCSFELSIH